MADGFICSAPVRIDAGSGYHSHPHGQRSDSFRWRFNIRALHAAHNLIHMTVLPICRMACRRRSSVCC